ncbi:MAG: DUF3306 domain-containing protein [Geminicoccaceae bacterium]
MAGRKGTPGDQPEAGADDGGFLGRWSRRKAEAKAAEETGPAIAADLRDAEAPSDLAAREANPATEETGEPPAFDVASLPDIDSLGPGSDFSMFMQTGVPSELKNKALRKLWRVKPELANLDGLLDYGEDLTRSFKVVDHLKTAYEVGRGFLRDQDDETRRADEQIEDGHEVLEREASTAKTPTDSETITDDLDEVDAVDDRDLSTDKA